MSSKKWLKKLAIGTKCDTAMDIEMNKTEILDCVEEYIAKSLCESNDLKVENFPPTTLLSKNRFDVIAKYIYARDRITGIHSEWAEAVYKEHLRAMNSFVERNNNKSDYDDFKNAFDDIIFSLQTDGYNPRKSLIPIGNDLTPINGAHRMGASIALNLDVSTVKLDKNVHSYDYGYFTQRGLDRIYMDYMALQYGKVKNDFHTAIVFPIVIDHINEIKSLLSKSGSIFYEKRIYLNRNGVHNLVLQMYRDHEWTTLIENKGFSKTHAHSFNRYVEGKEIVVFFIESTTLEQMKEVKKKIRRKFNMGNYPIHISDESEESIRISEQVLNQNSIHFLNHSSPKNNGNFSNLFKAYDILLRKNNRDKDYYCIDGSSVLAAYGLRDAKDLDYISLHEDSLDYKGINLHNSELIKYFSKLTNLIVDPRNHFYFNGYKFLTLENLKKVKSSRGQLKDKKDVEQINSILKKKSFFENLHSIFFYHFYTCLGFAIHYARRNTPKIVYPYVKSIYNNFKKLF